jgi:hypothetical protein
MCKTDFLNDRDKRTLAGINLLSVLEILFESYKHHWPNQVIPTIRHLVQGKSSIILKNALYFLPA